MTNWAVWARTNFNVMLLTVILVGLLLFTLHMSHDSMDREMVAWGREECAAVLGALLLALTGKATRSEDPVHPGDRTLRIEKTEHVDPEAMK